MTAGPRLLLGLTLSAALAGTVAAVPAGAAGCDDRAGVTVVVDFASLGGGTRTGCAPGDPSSGVAALRGAGHEPTRAAQEAGYFVCRIDGKPAADPCQRASPADAYWSYWHAQPGGSWTFSNTGPADYDPKPGSVEGWAFGAGDPPSSPPPRAAAAPAKPAGKPTPKQTSAAPPQAAAQPAPVRSSAAAVAAPAPTSAAAVASVAASRSAAPSATASAAPSASPSGSPTAAPAGDEPTTVTAPPADDDGGSLAGLLLAAGVVSLLAAAATRQVSQRRRRDEAV